VRDGSMSGGDASSGPASVENGCGCALGRRAAPVSAALALTLALSAGALVLARRRRR
jgi:hypothetical protein